MSSEVIDHNELGLSRLALQYSEAERLKAFISLLLGISNNIEEALQKLALMKDIDEAFGAHLDVIGDIVGVSRVIPNSVALKYFGFEDGGSGADIFGEEGMTGIGSRFYSEGDSTLTTTVLNDPEYRLLIRAKIVKNHSRGNGDSILAGLFYLFGPSPVGVTNFGDMHMGISIGRLLSFQEIAIIEELDILPCPAGVGITSKVMYPGVAFGFEGLPGAMPFGEEGLPDVGGIFAEEF